MLDPQALGDMAKAWAMSTTTIPAEKEAKLNLTALTAYPDVIIELIKEVKQFAPYIMKIDVRHSTVDIDFWSDDPLLELRLWGGNAIGCGLVNNFHCATIEG